MQSALEARSKIGVKPTRKYVRRKAVQAGSEHAGQAGEGQQGDQHMAGLESAHSGSPGLDGSSPGLFCLLLHSDLFQRIRCIAHHGFQSDFLLLFQSRVGRILCSASLSSGALTLVIH